jgi:methylated-DNA-[protein]-cysteine S-methyltransferase
MLHSLISTDRGWVGISYSERGVRRLTLPVRDKNEAMGLLGIHKVDDLHTGIDTGSMQRQVADYFSGKRTGFDFKQDLSGSTLFQRLVWQATAEIPYGQVRSYKWVAEKIDRPSACRAVGHALAANPLPAVIPCHRVIRNDGKPGGFGGRSGNVQTKLMMLSLEGYRFRP